MILLVLLTCVLQVCSAAVIKTNANGKLVDLYHPVGPDVYAFTVKVKGHANTYIWFLNDYHSFSDHDIVVHLDGNAARSETYIKRGHNSSSVLLKTVPYSQILRPSDKVSFWFLLQGGYFKFGRSMNFGNKALPKVPLGKLKVKAIKGSSPQYVIEFYGPKVLKVDQVPPLHEESYRLQTIEPTLYQPISEGPAVLNTYTGVKSVVECAALCERDRYACASSLYSIGSETCYLSDLSDSLEQRPAGLSPIHADSDFYLLLAITHASNIASAFDMWMAGSSVGSQPGSRKTCNCAYLNGERMKEYAKFKLIRYQFLEAGKVVVEMDYDTTGVNKSHWMTPNRLRRSYPYSTTYIKSFSWTIYGVAGHDATRRFLIAYYGGGGCPSDKGLIVVAEAKDRCSSDWRPLPQGDKKPGLYYRYKIGKMSFSLAADEFRLLVKY